MKRSLWFCGAMWSLCSLTFCLVGCDQQQMSDAVKSAEETAQEASETIATEVGDAVQTGEEAASDAVEKGKEMASDAAAKTKQVASDLSEKASAYLSPIKEKFGDLDSLKEKPEELKQAVSDLIASIESKAEGIELPESVSNALATIKEKLVALKDYLEGEVEQAKIDEHLKDIMESVKSGLGMSEN